MKIAVFGIFSNQAPVHLGRFSGGKANEAYCRLTAENVVSGEIPAEFDGAETVGGAVLLLAF